PGAVSSADLADRLEQPMCAVEVDAVALLEIRLGLARDDRRQVKDDVRARGDELFRLAGRGQVRDDAPGSRGHHVMQEQLMVLRQPLAQLAADHSRGAGDEDLHQLGSQIRHQGAPPLISPSERYLLLGKLASMTRVVSSRSEVIPMAS